MTDRIFEAQKLLAKQTVVLFDVCLGTFSTNASGVHNKKYLQMKRDVSLQTSRHQNWNCKSIRHSLLPVKRRLGVATPPCKTGWRHPDGVMAVCREDLWKYGRCFSAQEMERCLGSFYFKWEKRHHASSWKISGCVFDGSDLLEGVHIQMLTANSCNGILPDLCGWYIFRKSLSHSTPKHRYKAGSFLTFEHSDASPGLIHRGWLGGFYQSALGLWEDTPMVCNLAWSHSIGFFHSFCRDSDVINKSQRGEWDDTVEDTVNSS